MRLLTRYILLELIKVFSITLMGMTVVVLLACVAQEAVIQGFESLANLSADSLFLAKCAGLCRTRNDLVRRLQCVWSDGSGKRNGDGKVGGHLPLVVLGPRFRLGISYQFDCRLVERRCG